MNELMTVEKVAAVALPDSRSPIKPSSITITSSPQQKQFHAKRSKVSPSPNVDCHLRNKEQTVASARVVSSDTRTTTSTAHKVATSGNAMTTTKTTRKANIQPPPSSPDRFIQPWHVVLGDSNSRDHRTTLATKILRQVKREVRKSHHGHRKDAWIPLAIQILQERLDQEASFVITTIEDENHTTTYTRPDDVGRVLVRCTPKALESGRIEQAFLYGYDGDAQAWYGTGKMPDALDFFLSSRDAPILEDELARHQKNLADLRRQCIPNNQPPVAMMNRFQELLDFAQSFLKHAEDGETFSASILDSLGLINKLKAHWKILLDHANEYETTTADKGVTKEQQGDQVEPVLTTGDDSDIELTSSHETHVPTNDDANDDTDDDALSILLNTLEREISDEYEPDPLVFDSDQLIIGDDHLISDYESPDDSIILEPAHPPVFDDSDGIAYQADAENQLEYQTQEGGSSRPRRSRPREEPITARALPKRARLVQTSGVASLVALTSLVGLCVAAAKQDSDGWSADDKEPQSGPPSAVDDAEENDKFGVPIGIAAISAIFFGVLHLACYFTCCAHPSLRLRRCHNQHDASGSDDEDYGTPRGFSLIWDALALVSIVGIVLGSVRLSQAEY